MTDLSEDENVKENKTIDEIITGFNKLYRQSEACFRYNKADVEYINDNEFISLEEFKSLIEDLEDYKHQKARS